MVTRKVTIEAPNGMHARPAGELVKRIREFAPTKVALRSGAKEVNAASILSILSLGLKRGAELEVVADGPREQEAADAVADFIVRIRE